MGLETRPVGLSSSLDEKPLFADWAILLAEGATPELPSVGQIEGAGCLLYRSRLNEIHAEPGVGKTNVALVIALDVLRQGQGVLYLDPEDVPKAIGGRLLNFGATRDQLEKLFFLVEDPTPADFARIVPWTKKHRPTLIVVDGLAEIIAADGANEDIAGDVLRTMRQYFRPLTECGAAVLVTDHVAKVAESRGRWSRGSGAKLGRYDGAVYSVQVVNPYSPAEAGHLRLLVAKDRNGGVGPVGRAVAEIEFLPRDKGTSVAIRRPGISQQREDPYRSKILDFLREKPDASKRDLRRHCGKTQRVDAAIEELQNAGLIRIVGSGRGKSNRYEIVDQSATD